MTEMKRLLVATDLSDRANDAIERAALIARDAGARLDLVYIATPEFMEGTQPPADHASDNGATSTALDVRKALQTRVAVVRERYGISCGFHMASGSLIDQLAFLANEHAADLIVLGFSEDSLVSQLLLGSTAERMMNKAPCPVLVVKRRSEGPYRSVLVPVDFSPVSQSAISGARSVAPTAAMSLLHVFEAPFEGMLRYAGVEEDTMMHYRAAAHQQAIERMTKLCVTAGMDAQRVRLLAVHRVPSLRIVARGTQQRIDLITMGKQSESVLENLFVGSVTRRVISRSRCDVLICPRSRSA